MEDFTYILIYIKGQTHISSYFLSSSVSWRHHMPSSSCWCKDSELSGRALMGRTHSSITFFLFLLHWIYMLYPSSFLRFFLCTLNFWLFLSSFLSPSFSFYAFLTSLSCLCYISHPANTPIVISKLKSYKINGKI